MSEEQYQLFSKLYNYFNNIVRHENPNIIETAFNIPLSELGMPSEYQKIKKTLRSMVSIPMEIEFNDHFLIGGLITTIIMETDISLDFNEEVYLKILSDF